MRQEVPDEIEDRTGANREKEVAKREKEKQKCQNCNESERQKEGTPKNSYDFREDIHGKNEDNAKTFQRQFGFFRS